MADDNQPQRLLPVAVSFTNIPVIDIRDARSSNFQNRRKVALDIRKACINVGFFYITSHEIPQAAFDRVIAQARRFFDEPVERKMLIDIHKTRAPHLRGYTALLTETNNAEMSGELHEALNFGWDDPDSTQGTNLWPANLVGFKEPVVELQAMLVDLGKTLYRMFALALDLSETFFDGKTKGMDAVTRFMLYPKQAVGEEVPGVGEHADYECFTVLWQDGVPALQLLNASGDWIDAQPIPGTLIVNVGQLLERWSNDIFRATRHRALNRSNTLERYSIPTFFNVDSDVNVEVLPTCISASCPAKYEPIMAGDHSKAAEEEIYFSQRD